MRDALGAVQSVLVLGGSSDLGVAAAARLAKRRDARVVLAGRSPDELERAAERVRAEGVGDVRVAAFDAKDVNAHGDVIDNLFAANDGFDVVLLAFGVLGDQQRAEADAAHAIEIAETNYLGAMSAALESGRRLADQGHGTLVVLSSVAGERARRSNFVYGSTKAGLDAFSQGLGDALRPRGVDVVVVRPGFVHTKMTAGRPPAPLSTTPEAVAEVIERAVARGTRIVWAPPVLRWVMAALRHLPHAVFRRLPM